MEEEAKSLSPQMSWYYRNKEKVALYKKQHYASHLEDYKRRAKVFSQSNTRKKWKEENKDNIKKYHKDRWLEIKKDKPHLKNSYGITSEEYYNMLKAQNNKCLGCNVDQDDLDYALHVDHCHINSKVRGLLCRKCNSVLGLVSDKVEVLSNLINYLRDE